MAADVKLLPLPELVPDPIIGHLLNDVDREFCEQYAISYARASVEAATEALRKRCEAVEADAARYRAIRAVDDSAPVGSDGYPRLTQWEVVASARGSGNLLFGTDLDRAADAIIAAAQEPSHG